jgi:hypothetical protein
MGKTEMKIMGEWEDDMIWCPSQCYLNVSHENNKYVIYLRWRWGDPWTASLIPANENYDLVYKTDWINLFNEEDFYTDDQLEACKLAAIEKVKTYFGGNLN